MKNVFVCILLLVSLFSFSQKSADDKLQIPDQQSMDSLTREIEKTTASLESAMEVNKQRMEAEARHRDSLSNIRNLEWFMAERREQDRKQTRNLIVRGSLLGVGVLLAIAGSVRRRRMAKKEKMQ